MGSSIYLGRILDPWLSLIRECGEKEAEANEQPQRGWTAKRWDIYSMINGAKREGEGGGEEEEEMKKRATEWGIPESFRRAI